MHSLWNLDGRVAIVTGASSGLGERFPRVLHAAGMHVVAAARRVDRLETLAAELPGVVPVGCDVSDDEACRALVATALERFGRIDTLINNAGLSDSPHKAEEEPPEVFRQVIEVNLNACFVLSSLVAPTMLAAGAGSIINIGSAHSFVGSSPNNQAAYVVSKHGVVGLTRELALQWARRGVRVNAIAPGYFETELTEAMFEDGSSGQAWITRNTPMRRPGLLAELDGVLVFLASDASSYVTGQTIAVDGGWTIR